MSHTATIARPNYEAARYDAACAAAATRQGLDEPAAVLAAAGAEYAIEQTGGFVMVLTVPVITGTYAVTNDGELLVGFYPGNTWHEGPGEDALDFTPIDPSAFALWAHTVAALQTATLPSLDVVEAAGLDATQRDGNGPVTWAQVLAAQQAQTVYRWTREDAAEVLGRPVTDHEARYIAKALDNTDAGALFAEVVAMVCGDDA